MSTNSQISILDNINGEIRRHGMSKEEFCKLIGVRRETYNGWQSRGEIPSTKLLICAKVLDCTLDYLTRDVIVELPPEPLKVTA